MSATFPIIWLTGNSGAGKTTLATGLEQYCNTELGVEHAIARRVVVLDGDEMRATVSRDEGFSAEDRRKHNLRVARLAALMRDKGFLVIVAVIAPFEGVREELSVICDPLWVYVKRSGLGAEDRPYESPLSPSIIIDNDILTIEEGREMLTDFILQHTTSEQLVVASS